jgi:hypothetical protein
MFVESFGYALEPIRAHPVRVTAAAYHQVAGDVMGRVLKCANVPPGIVVLEELEINSGPSIDVLPAGFAAVADYEESMRHASRKIIVIADESLCHVDMDLFARDGVNVNNSDV